MPIICNPCSGESAILLKDGKTIHDFCVAELMEKRGDLKNGKIHCRCYAQGHPLGQKKELGPTPSLSQEELTQIDKLRTIESSKVVKRRSFHYDYWSDDVLLELFNWLVSRLKTRISLLFKPREAMNE